MTTLFCHIGWMKRYEGQTEDDQLQGGGSYVVNQKTGHEVCNFASVRGRKYGYVQVGKERNGHYQEGEINLERLGATNSQDELAGVTVIWTATDIERKRRKVVGWYENATIFRRFQRFEKPAALQMANSVIGYWVSAPADSCVLLAEDARTHEVPRMKAGFPGISPIWYADSPQSADFVRSTLSYIATLRDGNRTEVALDAQNKKIAQLVSEFERTSYFADLTENDERDRLLREVVQRRGQAQFRRALMSAYGGRCAVTGCNAADALEAAHLIGYKGPNTQHVSNGILLRADIHTLFDLGLLSICPETLTVVLGSAMKHSSYAELHGKSLSLPLESAKQPNYFALKHRWTIFVKK